MGFPRLAKHYAQIASASSVSSASIVDGAIVNADINAAAAIAFSKLAALASTKILVGSAANVATAVTVTGDVTIGNTGVTAIASGVIVNDDVNASAAIAFSKLAALTSGHILVGNGSNVATDVAMSGDVTISNAGVTSLSTPFAHTTEGLGRVEKMAVGIYSYGVSYSTFNFATTDVSAANNTITKTGHGYAAGTVMDFTTTDTLPAGLSANTAYYIGEIGTDTFKLYDTYAHAVAGGATGLVDITDAGAGTHSAHLNRFGVIPLGITLPDNAIISGGLLDVITAFVDIDDGTNNTEALHLVTANDIFSAANLTAGLKDVVPDETGSTAIKLTADKKLFLTIGTEQIKSGKVHVYLRYIQSV